LERRLCTQAGSTLWQNGLGIVQTLRIIGDFRPQLIVGTGGYASFAPIFWGTLLRIPTVIHEQNVVPGLVNRLLAPWVNAVMVAYPDTARFLRAKRIVTTGVPLRSSILAARDQLDPCEAKCLWKLDPSRPVVLVLGGSHGARVLHEQVLQQCERLLCRGIQLAIVAGKDAVRLRQQISLGSHFDGERITVLEHTPDMGSLLKAADLVVCRAGGSTLAELTALGKPAIVVPWPGAASHHQERNARWLAERGACRLLLEDQLPKTPLVDEILSLLADQERLRTITLRSAELGRTHSLNQVIREVESYLDYGTRSQFLSLYRNRRGWDERLGLGAPRARPSRQRLGS